jgi:hypothetical protein
MLSRSKPKSALALVVGFRGLGRRSPGRSRAAPFQRLIARMVTIPGVGQKTAPGVVGEPNERSLAPSPEVPTSEIQPGKDGPCIEGGQGNIPGENRPPLDRR